MFDRIIRCQETVNQPYPRVRAALIANPLYVFRHATAASATGAAALHVPLGPIDVTADVTVRVVSINDEPGYDETSTNVIIEWEAKRHAAWFPSMRASLELYPVSPTEARLRFEGEYVPPMGQVGELVDAIAGRRIAEASVTRFVQEVAGWLREELATPIAAAVPTAPAGAADDAEC